MDNFNKIADNFFDSTKPCPDIIPFCTQLRAKYLEEVGKLGSGCASCKTTSIKVKYITELWQNYIQTLVKKS